MFSGATFGAAAAGDFSFSAGFELPNHDVAAAGDFFSGDFFELPNHDVDSFSAAAAGAFPAAAAAGGTNWFPNEWPRFIGGDAPDAPGAPAR